MPKNTQEYYNQYQLDRENCKIHPRVLLRLLHLAAEKGGVTSRKLKEQCSTNPEAVVRGVFKTALVMAANCVPQL